MSADVVAVLDTKILMFFPSLLSFFRDAQERIEVSLVST